MATNPQKFDFDIGDVTGEKGDTGNGIKSIQLLSTSGLVKTYRITFTDDTHFDFSVSDGEDGDDGNGISGVSFDQQTNALTITFDDGTSFTTPSLKGSPGTPGDDGYSPAVTIETITGGHRVTITDEDHPTGQSFDVMDGSNDAGSVTYDETATYQAGSVGAELQEQSRQLSDKQDAPATAGTAGQVLGLDSNLNPAWVNQTGSGGGGMNIVTLTGTQITQVGADNTFYVCGELSELTFTAPTVGITMIRFTSGTTPTVLTVNGVTSWMYDNDPTAASLEANKTYDINVLNGVGVVGWA